MKLFLYFGLFFIFVLKVEAQQRPSKFPQGYPTNVNPGRVQSQPPPRDSFQTKSDSLKDPFFYQYFFLLNPSIKKYEHDSSFANFFHEVEVAKKTKYDHINTGNNGSSPMPILFNFLPNIGFSSGYSQYRLYNFTIDSLRFYDNHRTMADLHFSQIIGNQGNFETGAKYGQRYVEGIDLSINFRRVLQVGYYANQGNRTTNFSAALRFNFLKRKLKVTTAFILNNNNENHNGGTTADLTKIEYQIRASVPTILSEAATRYAYNDYILNGEYALDKGVVDSAKTIVGYRFSFKDGYSKFSDKTIDTNDSILYAIPNIDKIRGIRNYYDLTQVANEFYLRGRYKVFDGRLGLVYNYSSLRDAQRVNASDITLRFHGVVRLGKSFSLNTQAAMGLGQNVGAFDASASTAIALKKYIHLQASAQIFNSQKSYVDEVLYLSSPTPVYNKDFTNPLGSVLNAALYLPILNLSVGLNQTIINNYIYRDSFNIPKQDNAVLSVSYLTASHKLKLWRIGLENHAFVQVTNKDYLTLPNRYLKTDLYYEGYHFKKVLLLRLGAEYTLIPDMVLPNYHPVTGHYYLSKFSTASRFENVDLYLSAKVSKFRLFVKWENYLDVITGKINYLAVNHPQFDATIRFGLRWLFLD